jgi:polygalacturonase
MRKLFQLSALILSSVVNAAHSILKFGAIPTKTDLGTEFGNAAAFYKAVMFAHNHKIDKEVLIPANLTFSMVTV